MPTARELLEQADALMRRNRTRAGGDDIPVLTDAVPEPAVAGPARPGGADELPAPEPSPSTDQAMALPPEASARADARTASPASTGGVDEVPARTPAEPVETASIAAPPDGKGAPSPGAGAVGPGEGAPARPVQELGDDDRSEAPASPESAAAAADARWDAVADEVLVGVLRELEGFAATSLPEALGGRMKPIVDRARAELEAAVNAQVAEILRAHVAAAIEREIERRRATRDAS